MDLEVEDDAVEIVATVRTTDRTGVEMEALTAVAVAGLGMGLTGVTVLCGLMDVSPTAPTVAAMVGLGVGIDYALLMLTRILEHVRSGEEFVDAAAHASTTAGRSVGGAYRRALCTIQVPTGSSASTAASSWSITSTTVVVRGPS